MTDSFDTSTPKQQPSLTDVVESVGCVGYHWDLLSDRLSWFGDWRKMFGSSRQSPPSGSDEFAQCIFSEDRHLVFVDGGDSFERQYRLRTEDGRTLWIHESGASRQSNGRAVWQRGLLRVISGPQKSARHTTAVTLECDALTGRPNRSFMIAQINHLLSASEAVRAHSCYLAVSIDKMAFVNEAVGMESADALLRGVADRIAGLLPEKATLARVGGDMFGVLLPEAGEDAHRFADRILQNFRDKPVNTATAPIHVTVSIGGARLDGAHSGAQDVIIRAEQALREARNKGRNQYVEYKESASRIEESRTLLRLGETVKHALKNDELRLAFQPIIEAKTGKVLFYEALARIFGEDGKPIPAGQFIPAAERQGLALDLDRHVLATAVKELEACPTLTLAINISGLTAAQAHWPEHVQRVLGSKPDVARRLIIEITETAAIMDVAETRRFAEAMKQLGGRVALDDFGAGFTSIRHLRALPLSIMKIDMDLLHNLMENPEQQHLVRMLIGIASGLGLQTVAEGVETEDVANWLRKENVDMMQGYFFGRPSLDRPWQAR